MRNKKALFPLLAVICLLSASSCNDRTTTTENAAVFIASDAPGDFFDKPAEYLDWQSASLLNIVRSIISVYPPQVIEPQERQMALVMLDAVFHDEGAPHRNSVQEFHHQQISSIINELQKSEVKNGMMIWKLYDTITLYTWKEKRMSCSEFGWIIRNLILMWLYIRVIKASIF
ncbi:hypothetical protein [Lascolabacillus sp.]|jgi:hypothetical protein|uniref:hypothetical protein n=1 Tax=Lascolabacillus sp. TaxID=1924068 RepID=UPI002582B3FF|nr:hypothetical protein [Lascolabacillus sp.]MDD2606504.1 hypothetical protein [Lascolabacillus sp.]